MQRLMTIPGRRALVTVALASLAATVAMWLLLRGPERVMQSRGYGIVPYELAFSAQRAGAILDTWGSAGREAARQSLWMDFGFMPAYGVFFASLTLLVTRAQRRWWQRVGLGLVAAPLAAMLLDGLENLMLLAILDAAGAVPPASVLVAGVAATLKFTLLGLAVLYWLAGGTAWALRRATPGGS